MATLEETQSEVTRLAAAVQRLQNFTSPLFPTASRSLKRATEAARKLGLVPVPYSYNVNVAETQDGATSVNLQLDTVAAQGPLVITDIQPPHHRELSSMIVKAGNEFLTDGYALAGDSLMLPRRYLGRLMSSPITIVGGDVLSITLDHPGSPFVEGEGIRFNGIGVRAVRRNSRQLGPVTDEQGQQWLDAVAGHGQWWATTVQSDGNTAFATTSGDVVVEAVVIATRKAGRVPPVEGVQIDNATSMNLTIGDHQMTPLGTDPRIGTQSDDDDLDDIITVLPGLYWPLPSSTRVQLFQLQYPLLDTEEFSSQLKVPMRVTLIGRRGGSAGSCW